MFNNYKHVLDILELEKESNLIYKIHRDYKLIILPMLQKENIIIKVKKNNRDMFLFNKMNYALVEYPEQLYHIIKHIKNKITYYHDI